MVKVAPCPGHFEGAPDGGVCRKRCWGSREQALGCEAGGALSSPEHPKKKQGKNQRVDGAAGKRPAKETDHKREGNLQPGKECV